MTLDVILVSTQTYTIGVPVLLVMVCLIGLLLRNRERCPKDGTSMELVPPPQGGKHMVFKCSRCGRQKKTRVRVGRR